MKLKKQHRNQVLSLFCGVTFLDAHISSTAVGSTLSIKEPIGLMILSSCVVIESPLMT